MIERLCCGLFLVKSGQFFLDFYVFLTILDAAQHVVVSNEMIIFLYSFL